MQPTDRSHFSDLAPKCLQTLVSRSDVKEALTSTMDAHVPRHTNVKQQNHLAIIVDMLDKKNTPQHYLTARRPEVHEKEGAPDNILCTLPWVASTNLPHTVPSFLQHVSLCRAVWGQSQSSRGRC